MAKENREYPRVDEELFREMVSKGGKDGSVLNLTEEDIKQRKDVVPVPPAEGDGKRKRVLLPDFEQTFMNDRTVRRRAAMYVADEYRDILTGIVDNLGDKQVSAAGYLENIIKHHLELYKDEINNRYIFKKPSTLL